MAIMINVSIVGVGLVGKELVRIMTTEQLSHTFRIVSLTNSKRTVSVPADAVPFDADQWFKALADPSATAKQAGVSDVKSASPSVSSVVDMLANDVANGQPALLIDCTSDLGIPERAYADALRRGVSVATPNKKGFSSSRALFEQIRVAQATEKAGSMFFESTVGAGLPIISTLRDLLITGDRIHKVEGVFSGTLSYIFNEFSPAKSAEGAKLPSFSEVVKVAKEKGYTEPNPGDDLNGADVARKLTILSRLIHSHGHNTLPHLENGYASLDTTSLVPEPLSNITDGDELMRRLPEFDADYSAKRDAAAKNGNVLRFVGEIDVASGVVRATLKEYPLTHPFAASLSGSDNIVSFTTDRYPNPLIIQGAGAGAAVTAMGVLADAFRAAERSGVKVNSF